MTLNQALIAELRMEAANTRKMLERVPTDNSDWKPHEKSMKIGNLANHVAELPTWINLTMETPELDLSTMKYTPTIATSTDQLLAQLDNAVNNAVFSLEKADEEEFSQPWTLRNGDHVIFTLPKIAVLRSMVFSHHYHHRGQLSVYLRLLNIPVPGMYGPSSDDVAALAAAAAATAEVEVN